MQKKTFFQGKKDGVSIYLPKDEILVAAADTVYRKGGEEKKELEMFVKILIKKTDHY